MENLQTKVCNKCGRELPIEQFSSCKRNPDGLQYYCKDCVAVYNAKRQEAKKQNLDTL